MRARELPGISSFQLECSTGLSPQITDIQFAKRKIRELTKDTLQTIAEERIPGSLSHFSMEREQWKLGLEQAQRGDSRFLQTLREEPSLTLPKTDLLKYALKKPTTQTEQPQAFSDGAALIFSQRNHTQISSLSHAIPVRIPPFQTSATR